MPYDLPDILLTPDVMRRVQGRLLGIFGGVRAKGLDPNPPRVIRRHRDPIFGSSKGRVRRKLRMKPMKIRISSGIKKDVDVGAREEIDDQEEVEGQEQGQGQGQEQEREQEQEEEEEGEGEEQYEEMYVEEEEEGDDADISGKLSSIEKLEIQKEILRNLLAYRKGEKGENSESENENEEEDEDEDKIEDERILKKRRRHFLRNRVRLRIDDIKNNNDIKNEGDEKNEGIEEVEGSSIPKKKWRTRSLNEIVHDKRAKMMAIYQKKLSNLTMKKEKEKERRNRKRKGN